MDQYKASYRPHRHAHQPNVINSHSAHREGQLDQLQREFLDSTQRESHNPDLGSGKKGQEFGNVKGYTG